MSKDSFYCQSSSTEFHPTFFCTEDLQNLQNLSEVVEKKYFQGKQKLRLYRILEDTFLPRYLKKLY